MTKEERKALALERKKKSKFVTVERKNIRKNIVRNGGRF